MTEPPSQPERPAFATPGGALPPLGWRVLSLLGSLCVFGLALLAAVVLDGGGGTPRAVAAALAVGPALHTILVWRRRGHRFGAALYLTYAACAALFLFGNNVDPVAVGVVVVAVFFGQGALALALVRWREQRSSPTRRGFTLALGQLALALFSATTIFVVSQERLGAIFTLPLLVGPMLFHFCSTAVLLIATFAASRPRVARVAQRVFAVYYALLVGMTAWVAWSRGGVSAPTAWLMAAGVSAFVLALAASGRRSWP